MEVRAKRAKIMRSSTSTLLALRYSTPVSAVVTCLKHDWRESETLTFYTQKYSTIRTWYFYDTFKGKKRAVAVQIRVSCVTLHRTGSLYKRGGGVYKVVVVENIHFPIFTLYIIGDNHLILLSTSLVKRTGSLKRKPETLTFYAPKYHVRFVRGIS